MKRIITISLLILAIVSSLLAGTMAYYTTTVDNLATGSVTAKEFIFLSEAEQFFTVTEKIAPSETVRWSFKIMNHKGTAVTETEQYYKLTFDVTAAENKLAIDPLVVTVKDDGGNTLHSVTGTDVFNLFNSFTLNGEKQTREYFVEMHWPADGTNDSAYAGNKFGTAIKVSAVASQAPFNESGQPQDPQNPEDPQNPDPGQPQDERDIRVTYQVTKRWNSGNPEQAQPYFEAEITIDNLSEQPIQNWNITFDLPNIQLENIWETRHDILSSDSHRFLHPENYNKDILAGSPVSFGYNGQGTGESPQNVKVNGQEVQLVYIPFEGN